MVTEFAEITIKPGTAAQFIAAVAAAKPVFDRAEGCHGVALHHSIESPLKFVLVVKWETLAHHTELFRNAPDFQIWRSHAGPFFDGPPHVWHSETVVS
jgi:heme-degrading monooxygenase HmoA